MAIHNRAGQPAQQSDLINVAQLTAQYYVLKPTAGNAEHAVKFGTSGHRGSAGRHSFNEPHILAIAQAIAEERAKNGITGPCYVGKDTHALSEPALSLYWKCWRRTALTSSCRKITALRQPLLYRTLSRSTTKGGPLADGIVITPSHNPPEDGGIKYNPPNGGPADTNVTKVVEDRANALLAAGLQGVKRMSLDAALASGHVKSRIWFSRLLKDWLTSSTWRRSKSGSDAGCRSAGRFRYRILEAYCKALQPEPDYR